MMKITAPLFGFLMSILSVIPCQSAIVSLEEILDFDDQGGVTWQARIVVAELDKAELFLPAPQLPLKNITSPSKICDSIGRIEKEAGDQLRIVFNQLPNMEDTVILMAKMRFNPDEIWQQRPFGNLTWEYSLTNSLAETIQFYTLSIFFPKDLQVNRINKTVPEYNAKKSIHAPFRLTRKTHQDFVELKAGPLTVGRSASITLSLKKKSRSSLPFFIGGLMAILYLIFYRDLIAISQPSPDKVLKG